MKYINRRIILPVFLALLAPSLCHGSEGHSHDAVENPAGIEALSPGLRDVFSREMLELQKGLNAIVPLYVSGDWSEIATIAGRMENSYVLKQSLSKSQRHELHSLLPESFLELDQQFHYLAGMLKHAAEMEKVELIGFYLSETTEACVGCHARYASHKFPALSPGRSSHDH